MLRSANVCHVVRSIVITGQAVLTGLEIRILELQGVRDQGGIVPVGVDAAIISSRI
jgi:hypothetical protein